METTFNLQAGKPAPQQPGIFAVGVQFGYPFVTDDEGLKVVEITEPTRPRLVPDALVPLKHARRFYLARTYAYVANGPEGLAFIDITNLEEPKLDRMYDAAGLLNDTRAVQIGSVNASLFALVADGKNGLRVLQMISPNTVPGSMGFSPPPNPKLIATYPTHGEALAVSRGLDRDRVVDETGNQTVVFGRRGSRPFDLKEMSAFYRHHVEPYPTDPQAVRTGEIYRVDDVVVRNRQLLTRGGAALPQALPFQPLPKEDPTPKQPPSDRLFRRGK